MKCDDSRIYLSAYLDDELDVAESLRVQKHLAECRDCREAQDQQLALRSALRDPELYAYPSADFSKRLQASVRQAAKEEAQARRPKWTDWLRIGSPRIGSFGWVPAAAALAIVTTVGALLVMNGMRSSHDQVIASAVLAGHIRSLQADHLMDVPSSDRHTVKPWFQGKLDFSPPVPDLSEMGWTLIGGRLDYVDGRPVAALIYQRRMHNINVFVWPNHDAADSTIKQEDAQGYQILHWNGAEMTYWVVSDLNREELLDLARALRGH
jgi:anti-sigma factor RsiW